MTLNNSLSSETVEFLEISCSLGVWGWEEGEWGDVCGCGGESRLTGDWGSDWESSVVDLTRGVVGSIFQNKEWNSGRKKPNRIYECFTFAS